MIEQLGIGFTGTRHGLTPRQARTFRFALGFHMPPDGFGRITLKVFHHGAAIGADAQAAKIAKEFGCELWAWRVAR